MSARGRWILLGVLVFGGVLALSGPYLFRKLFYPPEAGLVESYEERPEGPKVVHDLFDALLTRHVREDGRVDYGALAKDSASLDAYLEVLAAAPWDQLGRNERLALLINAYNACTLRLILDHYPLASIRDIPEGRRWKAKRWKVGGLTLSLDAIEHEYLRGRFREPRIHFAVNCASIGCPPLRREAYRADQLDRQLQEQALLIHGSPTWFRLDASGETVHLTRLYEWFEGDFRKVAGSLLAYAGRFAPDLNQLLEAGREPSISWIDYDWSLNDT